MESEFTKNKENLKFLAEERQDEINSIETLMKKQSKKVKEGLHKVENELTIVL